MRLPLLPLNRVVDSGRLIQDTEKNSNVVEVPSGIILNRYAFLLIE